MSTGAILNLTANRRTFHHDLNWPDATSIGATLKEEAGFAGPDDCCPQIMPSN